MTDSNKSTEETPNIEVEVVVESSIPLFWYVVHTYSGYENRAKIALEERK